MTIDEDKIREAVKRTEILRSPKQSLYTFGTTNLYYYLVTEPAYSDLVKNITETVVREGRVVAEKPRIVTPYYLSHLEGFSSEAKRYLDELIRDYGANVPGLFYTYKNEPKELTIVSDNMASVVEKLNARIDLRGDKLASIIKGEDELWDVSLMKFIFEVTRNSIENNVRQMGDMGLLNVDTSGLPFEARLRIDELFTQVEKGDRDPAHLKKELDRWGVFKLYEDRFFNIFKKRRKF